MSSTTVALISQPIGQLPGPMDNDLSECDYCELRSASSSSTNTSQDTTFTNEHGWGEYDVPIGRAKDVHDFIGNKRYRDLIDEYSSAYHSSTKRTEKTLVSMKIYKIVTCNGGRFLDKSKNDPVWREISEDKALSKISQALRMQRRRNKGTWVGNKKQVAKKNPFGDLSSTPFVLSLIRTVDINDISNSGTSDFEPLPFTSL